MFNTRQHIMKIAIAFMMIFFASAAYSGRISGAFVQIGGAICDYTQADWDEEISLMSGSGMDTLIVSAAIADGGKAHYQSSLDFVTEVTDNGLVLILNACDKYNVDCFVGLVHDQRWWTSVGNQSVLASMAANNIAAADELLTIVSQHSSFAGWYMTEEMVFNAWSGANRTMLINSLLKPVISRLKTITPQKPVATAPYVYDINAGADNCAAWWNYVLAEADFDIVMFQDGFGADINRKPEKIVPYFKALSQVCRAKGVQFWNDLEVFNQPDWTAKKFSDARWQASLNEKYVDKIVVWEWFYITPTQRMRSDVRTTDRQNFYVKMLAMNKGYSLVSLNKNYTLSREPSLSYPDVNNELTDSQVDFDMDMQTGFYLTTGFGGGTASVSITVDLRENVAAKYGFFAVFMKRPVWGVNLPVKVEVFTSQDNAQYSQAGQLAAYPADEDSLNVYFGYPAGYIKARYVRFSFSGTGWIMCSDVGVYRSDARGDFNDDEKVDINDTLVLADRWLQNNSGNSGDMNGFAAIAGNWQWRRQSKQVMRDKFLKIRNVQLSQGSPYMQGRSVESIASELSVNGVQSVFVMQTSANLIKEGIVEHLHNKGIGAGLMLFADAVYTPVSELPEGWQQWQAEFTNGTSYTHLSFVHPGFRQWMKERAVNLCNQHDFDAITFAEPMYPVYDGITKTPVIYADVSQAYQNIFKADTGESSFPNFTNPQDPDYFKTNTALYQKLVRHRIDSITNYFDEIVNGAGGLRELSPDTVVITWSLACSKLANGGVGLLPEWEGNDAYDIVKKSKPDMHYYQTHWPDWVDAALAPEHVYSYIPNFRECWRAASDVPVGVQDDIGSHDNMRRSNEYYEDFLDACLAGGAVNSTYYCFSLRSDVYNAAPELKRVSLREDGDLNDNTTGYLTARIGRDVGADGKVRLRIFAKDNNPNNWLFVSEIKINGQYGGFTYNISPQTPPYSGRPDGSGSDLSNGTEASVNFADADWVQWAPDVQGKDPWADIELTAVPGSRIEYIDIHFLKYSSTHVYPAAEIAVDGTIYKLKANMINLEFNQRIHADSASIMLSRSITETGAAVVYGIQHAAVDGNMLILKLDKPVQKGKRLRFDVGQISDDPAIRWTTANIAAGSKNTIPAATFAEMSVE